MNTLANGTARLFGAVRRNGSFIGRVTGDVMRISGAVGLGQALAFLAAPLLTRLYGPEAFGHFAILGALVNLLLPWALLRFNWALPLPQEDAEARDLLALCLLIVLAAAPLFAVIGVLAQPWLAGWLSMSVLDVVLVVVALAVTALHEIAMSWLVRHKAFAVVAQARFVTLVGVVGCQILLAARHTDATSLLLGYIGGYSLGMLRGAWHARSDVAASLRALAPARLRGVAVEYRRFPLVATPSSMVSAVSAQVPSLVMPSLYGLAVNGQLSLAARVLWQPTAFVGQAVNQVFWGNAARLQHEDPRRLWLLFLILNAGLLAAMAPALVLVWWGPELFGWIFGPAWATAGEYAGVLVLGSFVGLAAHGTESLHIYGRNHWMAAWEVTRLTFIAGSLVLSWWLELSPLACIAALTAGGVLANLSLLALNALAILRLRAQHGHDEMKDKARCAPAS